MKTTDELHNEIRRSDDILDYLEKNKSEMNLNTLPEYLSEWLLKKSCSRADVVRRSNLNKAYVYQIFMGRKYPSRDKIIALSFGLRLNCEEAQTLLKQSGYRELYPRDPRDALLLFAIEHNMNIISANELLYDHNAEVLE